jgi:hypothetical protein
MASSASFFFCDAVTLESSTYPARNTWLMGEAESASAAW